MERRNNEASSGAVGAQMYTWAFSWDTLEKCELFPLMVMTTCLCTTWWHWSPALNFKVRSHYDINWWSFYLQSASDITTSLSAKHFLLFRHVAWRKRGALTDAAMGWRIALVQNETTEARGNPQFFFFVVFFSWFEFQCRLWLYQPAGIKTVKPKCQSSHLW